MPTRRRKHLARNNEVLTGLSQLTPTAARALGAAVADNANPMYWSTYVATVTVANGATTGKEAAIGMPTNFLPVCMAIHVVTASTNACALVDVGDDADTDSYCDGIVATVGTTTGFKGIVGCNGVRALGDITGGVQVATTTADEVEVVVSDDPGATGITYRLTFFGVQAA